MVILVYAYCKGTKSYPAALLCGPAVVRCQLESDVYHAAVAPLLHGKSASLEDREHPPVLTQHIGLELGEILVTGEHRQMSEEA